MQQRDRLLIVTLVIVTLVISLATWLASLAPEGAQQVGPLTTYSTQPHGAKALADALPTLGIKVRRFRRRATALPSLLDSTRNTLLVALAPARFSPSESEAMLHLSRQHDLLLAGVGNQTLISCFGWQITSLSNNASDRVGRVSPTFSELLATDSVSAQVPGTYPVVEVGKVARKFVPLKDSLQADSSRQTDATRFTCTVPTAYQVDTLLITPSGDPVALRIRLVQDGPLAILVADAGIFRNDRVRQSPGGSLVLGFFLDQWSEVLFDEYHHGYGQDGSVRSALLEWSRSSPWGWAIWQLTAVGVLLLLARAFRFGPTVSAIQRERRSSLEHVQALAAALSAAHGSDEAITITLRGFRRRLTPGAPPQGDLSGWLAGLAEQVGTARQRELVVRLQQFMQPDSTPEQVRLTALTVEELWQELRP